MKALDMLQKAREQQYLYAEGTSICIYGPPKVGKTVFAATAAKAPHVHRVVLYDFEHSYPSLFSARYPSGEKIITEDDLAKIEIITIPDDVQRPIAFETAGKIITAKQSFTIESNGKLRPARPDDSFIFDPQERGPNIVEIFDSGSQIADSVITFVMAKYEYKDLRKYYGEAALIIRGFLTSVQRCKGICIVVTHTNTRERDDTTGTKEIIAPYMGSINQSIGAAKYFDTIIYKEIQLKNYANISTATYKTSVIAGSRYNIALEKMKDPTMADVLTWKDDAYALIEEKQKQQLKPKLA